MPWLHSFLVLVLVEQGGVGLLSPHPVVCPLGCKESESLTAHQAFPLGALALAEAG